MQALIAAGPPMAADSPDAALYRQLTSLRGPLIDAARTAASPADGVVASADSGIGLDPARFGTRPDGGPIDATSLGVKAPAVVEVRLPDTAHRFKNGHRIRLQISGGAHPRYARNLGTGEPLGQATKAVPVTHTIRHDGEAPSSVSLPIG